MMKDVPGIATHCASIVFRGCKKLAKVSGQDREDGKTEAAAEGSALGEGGVRRGITYTKQGNDRGQDHRMSGQCAMTAQVQDLHIQ